ncbi:MAG: acetyl-CoA acetyltransferase, partial [Nocardioidaceae bacterium]|nr:acetyl-CoA acetyltransferase [Nocardioidaceae bacterium]
MTEVVIVDAIRSPIGRAFKGSLKDVRPDDLGGMLVKAIMERNPGVPPESIEDLLCGVSGAAGPQGYNLGRIVGQLGGLPNTVPGTSVNRFCASSLQAVKMAHNAIMADEGDTILVLGVESVSRRSTAFTADDFNPRFVDESRPDFVNHMYIDNVDTAENVSKKYGVSREDQDALAYQSQMRASKASEDGTFAREIVGIQTEAGLVTKDDGPRPQTTMEKLAELKPLKGEGGTVTAGNACPMNDGASAALIMSADRAKALGLKPRARIL